MKNSPLIVLLFAFVNIYSQNDIKAEKLEDIAVTSIWKKLITPKITNTEYPELNKLIITNFICLKI